jgi:HlyD family secretion protein
MSVVSLKTNEPKPATASGTGMDKAVETRRLPLRTRLIIGGIAIVLAGSVATWVVASSTGSQTVETANLSIATVRSGTFDDFVPLRARVTPSVTVFLDAVEGGRIERVRPESIDGLGGEHDELAALQPTRRLGNDRRIRVLGVDMDNLRHCGM